MRPPLADLRVLECGDALAVAYAGRQLADLGADVVKVEAPQGDPLRAVGPFVGGRETRCVPSGRLSAGSPTGT